MDAKSDSSELLTPRTCSTCKKVKTLSDFYKYPKSRSTRGDGYQRRCKECILNYNKKFQNTTEYKEKIWANKITYRYGITSTEYQERCEEQSNRCAICFKTPEESKGRSKTKLVVDHCHETNKVRGLLCSACNSALGLLGDDVSVLEAAVNYIKSSFEDRLS